MRVFPCSLVASALVLSACGSAGDAPSAAPTSAAATGAATSAAAAPATSAAASSTTAKASTDPEKIFADVLANPGAVPVNPAARYTPDGTYGYVFADVNSDGVKDMILRVNSAEFSPVVVLEATPDGGYLPSQEVIIDGAAGAGGSRSRVLTSESGNGIYEVGYYSIHPDIHSTRYSVAGGHLTVADKQDFTRGQHIPDAKDIIWLDTKTGQPMWEGQETRGINGPGGQEGQQQATPPAAEQATGLTGTVRLMTNSEIMGGQPTPNGEDPAETHWMLDFGGKTEITATKLNTVATQSTRLALLDGVSGVDWSGYQDKQVTLQVAVDGMWWPSDASIPLGGLRIKAVQGIS